MSIFIRYAEGFLSLIKFLFGIVFFKKWVSNEKNKIRRLEHDSQESSKLKGNKIKKQKIKK